MTITEPRATMTRFGLDDILAEVVRVRREQGVYGPLRRRRSLVRVGFLTALLALAFLVI